MGSNSKPLRDSISAMAARRSSTGKTFPTSKRRLHRRVSVDGSPNYSSVSDKLEALQRLIPVNHNSNNGEIIKADQLFKQTADYILQLRTQVSVLQGLVDLYDESAEAESQIVQ